jgi:putative copper export protein
VVALASTAAFQGWVLAGGLSGLLGTAYGWVALFKLTIFAVLLVFAALNYLRLVPALARYHARAAKLWLVRSIAVGDRVGIARSARRRFVVEPRAWNACTRLVLQA